MHIKFLNHGTGDPQKAVNYLLALHDHNGHLRPEVKVLCGNPHQVADLAQSLPFVHRYTSAVIAWHEDDKPTLDEARNVVADFERLAFAGLEPDQFACTAIWHGGHVHMLSARVELRTGKSHNIAPPNGKKAFDHLRDKWNYRMGWARPDDPKRARLFQPGGMVLAQLSSARRVHSDVLLTAFLVEPELRNNADKKTAIAEWIKNRVMAGEINDRKQVIAALGELGEISRVGDDYMSVTLSNDDAKLRFKGVLFDSRFDADHIRAANSAPASVAGVGREPPNLGASEAARKKLDTAVLSRAAYNRKTYQAPAPSPTVGMAMEDKVTQEHSIIFEVPKVKASHDRNRNPFIASAFESFEAARSAVRRLVHACQSAVVTFGAIERASDSAERASYSAEQARDALIGISAFQNVEMTQRDYRRQPKR